MSTPLSTSAFDASFAVMPMQLQMSALLETMLDDTAPIAFGLLHLDVVVCGGCFWKSAPDDFRFGKLWVCRRVVVMRMRRDVMLT